MSTYIGTFIERIPGEDPITFAEDFVLAPVELVARDSFTESDLDFYECPETEDDLILYVHTRFFVVLENSGSYVNFSHNATSKAKRFKGLVVTFIMNDTAMASSFKLIYGGGELAAFNTEELVHVCKFDGIDFAGLKTHFDTENDVMTQMAGLLPRLLDPPLEYKELSLDRYDLKLHYNWTLKRGIDEKQVFIEDVRRFLHSIDRGMTYDDDDDMPSDLLTREIERTGLKMPDYRPIWDEMESMNAQEIHAILTSIGPIESASNEDIPKLLLAKARAEEKNLTYPFEPREWRLPSASKIEFKIDEKLYDEIEHKDKRLKEEAQRNKAQEETWKETRIDTRNRVAKLLKENKVVEARSIDPEFDVNMHYYNLLKDRSLSTLKQPQEYPELDAAVKYIQSLGQKVSPLPDSYLTIMSWTDEKLQNTGKLEFDLKNRFNPQGSPPSIESFDTYLRCMILNAEHQSRKSWNQREQAVAQVKELEKGIAKDVLVIIAYIVGLLLVLVLLFRGCAN